MVFPHNTPVTSTAYSRAIASGSSENWTLRQGENGPRFVIRSSRTSLEMSHGDVANSILAEVMSVLGWPPLVQSAPNTAIRPLTDAHGYMLYEALRYYADTGVRPVIDWEWGVMMPPR